MIKDCFFRRLAASLRDIENSVICNGDVQFKQDGRCHSNVYKSLPVAKKMKKSKS